MYEKIGYNCILSDFKQVLFIHKKNSNVPLFNLTRFTSRKRVLYSRMSPERLKVLVSEYWNIYN